MRLIARIISISIDSYTSQNNKLSIRPAEVIRLFIALVKLNDNTIVANSDEILKVILIELRISYKILNIYSFIESFENC